MNLKGKYQNLKIAYRIRQQIKYMIKLLEKKSYRYYWNYLMGTIKVKGYTKKDGTKVKGYTKKIKLRPRVKKALTV